MTLWWIDPEYEGPDEDASDRDEEPDDSSVSPWGPSRRVFDEGPY